MNETILYVFGGYFTASKEQHKHSDAPLWGLYKQE